MTEFSTDDVIRQTLRSLVHDLAMGVLASREDSKKPQFQMRTENLLRSPDFLKMLYENPERHIEKIINCGTSSKNMTYTQEQKNRIVAYLQEVNKLKPRSIRDWDTLRHYLYSTYRQLISIDPFDRNDVPSKPVLKEMRELVEGLMVEDTTQLFLRLFALIREFVMLARHFYSVENSSEGTVEQTYYLISLSNYYCALYTAAGVLNSVLPEFNELLKAKYHMSWLLLNKSIFYHYFYIHPNVKSKLLMLDRITTPKDSRISKYHRRYIKIKEDMQMIEKHWCKCLFEITERRRQMTQMNADFMDKVNRMVEEHKKILQTNFWLPRLDEQKLLQDMNELDAQIILWVGDISNIADQLLNFQGVCICEECMLAKYSNGLGASKNRNKQTDSDDAQVYSSSDEEQSDSASSDSENCDKITASLKNIAISEPKTRENKVAKNGKEKEKDMQGSVNGQTKSASQSTSDSTNPKIFAAHNKTQKPFNEIDPKVLNLLKNTNQNQKVNGKVHTYPCGHNCKHEEEPPIKDVPCCAHEYKKCDCTYCEVFGTSVSMHSHKTNETRDRLRSRLNQRKEKFNSTISQGAANGKATGSAPYPKSTSLPPTAASAQRQTQPMKRPDAISRMATSSHVGDRVPNPNAAPENIKSDQSLKSNQKGSETLPIGRSIWSISTCSLNSLKDHDNTDSRDINDLLNYIEGNKNIDKIALAQKKAAKKARQKQKKEQERLRLEEEKKIAEQRELEEKRKEEERLKAEQLAKELAEKAKKNKRHQEENSKSKKNKKQNNSKQASQEGNKPLLIEETIPAMVTIKRIVENNNSMPTVTITLKGSTPDQDKLLYTLVNGYNGQTTSSSSGDTTKSSKKKKKGQKEVASKVEQSAINSESKSSKKNNKNGLKREETTKELKVTLAVDKSVVSNVNSSTKKKKEKKENVNAKTESKPSTQKLDEFVKKTKPPKQQTSNSNICGKDSDLNIPIRLPPGITITKVDGPVTSRNCKPSNSSSTSNAVQHSVTPPVQQNSRVPVSKSGVIVVDTEKLIQQSVAIANSKKQKKKKNKKAQGAQEPQMNGKETGQPMVTLKNPIFHTLQTTLANKVSEKMVPELPVIPCNQQASIIKNENGMVTIRSPRLQQSLANGTPVPNLLAELKPVIGPDVSTPCMQACHTSFSDTSHISSLNAQEILSGLPGIEITKVDKRTAKNDSENKRSCQAADVSIIPTSNNMNGEKFSLDRDDWHYESVFIPKDILEDDLDAEERELEAFKRFCQQSVPPKRKEKVAHLNVKDIVLKKKTDVTYI